MTDLGWRAEGIERAIAAGGIPLETYRRPGFTASKGVRRSDVNGPGSGSYIAEPWPDRTRSWPDPELRHRDTDHPTPPR